MDKQDELDIITRIRGEVQSHKQDTGVNLFLVWGYPTALVFLLMFAALIFWDQNWCSWAWIGIPLIGAPLMMYFQQKDYERTGHRTHDQNAVTTMWLFIGAASAASGFTTGLAHIYVYSYCTLQGLFIGMGCFVTGLVSRFRPMTVCGAIGAALTFLCPFLQGDLWPWQFLVLVIVTIVAFIIPGHIIRKVAKI